MPVKFNKHFATKLLRFLLYVQQLLSKQIVCIDIAII